MLDIPGGHGKVPVGPNYLDGDSVRDWRGERHSIARADQEIDPYNGAPLSVA